MRSIHNINHQILEKNNHYLGIHSNIKRILTLINLLVDFFIRYFTHSFYKTRKY
jgi:hypothetical protein